MASKHRAAPIPFLMLFMAVGWVPLVMGIRGVQEARATLAWPMVTGRIVSSEVRSEQSTSRDDDGRERTTTYYYADVAYEYSVDGVSYSGKRITLSDGQSGSQADARATRDHYAPDASVSVSYAARSECHTERRANASPNIARSRLQRADLGMGARQSHSLTSGPRNIVDDRGGEFVHRSETEVSRQQRPHLHGKLVPILDALSVELGVPWSEEEMKAPFAKSKAEVNPYTGEDHELVEAIGKVGGRVTHRDNKVYSVDSDVADVRSHQSNRHPVWSRLW